MSSRITSVAYGLQITPDCKKIDGLDIQADFIIRWDNNDNFKDTFNSMEY